MKALDGFYGFSEIVKILDEDFVNEKQLCDYIEDNMQLFCAEILGVVLKNYVREYRVYKIRHAPSSPRIDFYIQTQDKKIIILECKKPKFAGENYGGIGQLLTYRAILKNNLINVDRLVLVTTKIDFPVTLLIEDCPTNIELIGFDKSKHFYFNKAIQNKLSPAIAQTQAELTALV